MIILDLEMTGLNPAKHAICSIGAVDFNNPERQFYIECCIPYNAEIDAKAMEVNGFTEEQVRDPKKKSVSECVRDFLEWCSEAREVTIAGQNVFFDWLFLKKVFDDNKLDWPFGHRVVDSHTAAYMHMTLNKMPVPVSKKRSDINLDKAAKYVGLNEEPKPHNALNGAKYSAEVLSRLLKGRNLLKDFKKLPLPAFLTK